MTRLNKSSYTVVAVESVLRSDTLGLSVNEIQREAHISDPDTRKALRFLESSGAVTSRYRSGVKHLPWQKSVPVRYKVYTLSRRS